MLNQVAFKRYLVRLLPFLLLVMASSAQTQPGLVTAEDGKAVFLESIFYNTIWPDEQEIEENPRSRSARLRAAEMGAANYGE